MTPDKEGQFMEIGLFGGSFNPPHVCHSMVTLWALQTGALDEVWWVPTYQHAFDKDLLDYEHRRKMCQLALRELQGVEISDVERELGGESRTIDTVEELEATYPEADFSLIVGADILEEKDSWKKWETLTEKVDLMVVGRSGHDGADDAREYHDFVLPDVSSTKVRDALRDRDLDWLRTWIPRRVLDYVLTHELYAD